MPTYPRRCKPRAWTGSQKDRLPLTDVFCLSFFLSLSLSLALALSDTLDVFILSYMATSANNRECVLLLAQLRSLKDGGPEGFRKVRGACRIQNLKDLSKSEFMEPSYGETQQKR